MPSTASTVISTVVDYGRLCGLTLAVSLALFTVFLGILDDVGLHWAITIVTVALWNGLTVFNGFVEYIHLRWDVEDVDWWFRNSKIRIPEEKTLGRFPWWETIILVNLVAWFWEPFDAAIAALCLLVLYPYIFLDLLQKRQEEIFDVLMVTAQQMELFEKYKENLKIQEENGDFCIVNDPEEEAEIPKIPKLPGVFKNPLNWVRCLFLIGSLVLESQYFGWDWFAVLFLAYYFHITHITSEFEKKKMIFNGYDEEVLECLKEIKKFQRSRKNKKFELFIENNPKNS
ncbi:unnamed protein product [Caenorhabditis nigoni]